MNQPKAYIWNFINKFGTQVIWLATSMILARFLSPDDFGVIGVLSVIFMVANTLTESGLGGALIIKKNITNEDCATIFIFNIVVSHLLYLVIFLSADLIETFYNVEGLAKITRVLGLVFVITSYRVVPNTLLCYDVKFKPLCMVTILSVIISAVIAVIMAYFEFGVMALVSYQLIQALISTIGIIVVSKYKFPLCFRWACLRDLFSFGAFTTLCGVIDTIYENLLTVIYGKFMNIAQAGYLSQAKKIEEASTQSLLTAINTTSFVLLAKKADNLNEFQKEASSILSKIPLLIFPILAILAVYSDEVILVLFGHKWAEASPYLSVLVYAGMFMILDSITRNFIKSLGYVQKLFYYTLAKRILGCLIIVLFGYMSMHLLIYGYVVSSAIGLIINCVLYTKLVSKSFRSMMSELFRMVLPIAILLFCLYISYYCMPSLVFKILTSVVVFSLYYYIIMKRLGINIMKKIMR